MRVSELYGSPALQADSLLSEPPGKPTLVVTEAQFKFSFKSGESLGSSGNMVEFRVLKDVICLSPSLGWSIFFYLKMGSLLIHVEVDRKQQNSVKQLSFNKK